MDKQSIDIKYISGRGISSPALLPKPCLFTTVYISYPSAAPRPLRQKTPTDPQGGRNPEWNHPIRLYFDSDHPTDDLRLRFDIRTQIPFLGDKLIGSVDVPVAALAADGGGSGELQHVTYQVIGMDGKENGSLSFSYILNDSPGRIGSDHVLVQDTLTLDRGTSYQGQSNDSEHRKVYPDVEKIDTKPQKLYPDVVECDLKPQLYPTVDTFENVDGKRFVYPSLTPDPSAQVYPPPPSVMPESKRSLYPVVSTDPVIAYPVLDSGYPHCPGSLGSYPRVEPAVGLASYGSPGHYPPPPQTPGYYHGWNGRY